MKNFYILGTTDNKYNVMDFNFDNVREDSGSFEAELIGDGYLFDYEDEGGFHYVDKSYKDSHTYAWIVKLRVPVSSPPK
ncbi:hypothetical protein [Enterococcus innesii]|nr:hypothetical protein [Enterococcus innesii]